MQRDIWVSGKKTKEKKKKTKSKTVNDWSLGNGKLISN